MENRVLLKRPVNHVCLIVTCFAVAPARAEFGDQLFKLTAPDAADFDNFGNSVAISGSKAIVTKNPQSSLASPDILNAAYVYDVTTGQQIQQLVNPSGIRSDNFGRSVAISGNTAIVGADHPSTDGVGDIAGAAYLFSVTTGQMLRKLTASDPGAGNIFGNSVAIDGNIALVGSPWDDDFGTDSGSAYVFDVATGQELYKLTASDASEGDWFGTSVAISGNIAIVGASNFDFFDDQPGAAYVFDVATGQELFKLTAPNPVSDDDFGIGVAIDGNIAIVGADELRLHDTGRAYIFDLTTRQVLHTLTASDGVPGDRIGFGVDISGDTAIVGGSDLAGKAYLFDVATGQKLMTLTNPDPDHVRFGNSVAIDGNTAVVGAVGQLLVSAPNWVSYPGSAYVFDVTRGPALPGDFNNDGTVDAADYIVWRNGLGTTYTQTDYNTWRANFGRITAGTAAVASILHVPEPASLALIGLSLFVVSVVQRRPSLRGRFRLTTTAKRFHSAAQGSVAVATAPWVANNRHVYAAGVTHLPPRHHQFHGSCVTPLG